MLTCTRDTAGADLYAVVAAWPEPGELLPAGPTQTGRSPACTDPDVGSAKDREDPGPSAGAAEAAMTAVPEPAAGQAAAGRRPAGIGAIRTFRPCTTCTGTGLPADEAGAGPQPPDMKATAATRPATSVNATPVAVALTHRRPDLLPLISDHHPVLSATCRQHSSSGQ
jgi:hypothetical protein